MIALQPCAACNSNHGIMIHMKLKLELCCGQIKQSVHVLAMLAAQVGLCSAQ
jgi:hypothetical protein